MEKNSDIPNVRKNILNFYNSLTANNHKISKKNFLRILYTIDEETLRNSMVRSKFFYHYYFVKYISLLKSGSAGRGKIFNCAILSYFVGWTMWT